LLVSLFRNSDYCNDNFVRVPPLRTQTRVLIDAASGRFAPVAGVRSGPAPEFRLVTRKLLVTGLKVRCGFIPPLNVVVNVSVSANLNT